jgi:hypothetical protein
MNPNELILNLQAIAKELANRSASQIQYVNAVNVNIVFKV